MDKRRTWLSIVLEEAMSLGIVEADDLLRHATPSVLATDLPPSLVASLLQTGLNDGTFSATMLVDHLGAENLAAHLPLPLIWQCLDEAAQRLIADHPLSSDGGESIADLPGGVIDADDAAEIEVIEE